MTPKPSRCRDASNSGRSPALANDRFVPSAALPHLIVVVAHLCTCRGRGNANSSLRIAQAATPRLARRSGDGAKPDAAGTRVDSMTVDSMTTAHVRAGRFPIHAKMSLQNLMTEKLAIPYRGVVAINLSLLHSAGNLA
jgi:hypothetical protein